MEHRNIRTYDFSIPGSVDRHIPGIPGTWPAGSRVTIDEDTKEIVNISPETFLASFAERLGDDAEINQDLAALVAPPALEKPANKDSGAKL